jgi:membrane associated rhomboid family serine protease
MVFIPVHDDNPLRSIRFQWVTVALIAANIAGYIFENTSLGQKVAASFAIIPYEVFYAGLYGGPAFGPDDFWPIPERVTLLSYMFLHGDGLHLASNMLFLWVFGDNVEDDMGHLRFLGFYLACGIIAGLAHAIAVPNSRVPLIGASGAVAGVIAAYVLVHPKARVWVLAFRFIPLRIPAWLVLGTWAIVQIVMVMAPAGNGPTAWWAHVGGLLAGAVLMVLFHRPGIKILSAREPDRPDRPERPERPDATTVAETKSATETVPPRAPPTS